MSDLLKNTDLLHTTKLGAERVKRNLGLETEDVVSWCAAQILREEALLERAGKNWYITAGHCRITVNAHSYTIITAHKLRPAL